MESNKEEQSVAEKTIFEAIAQGDMAVFKNILAEHKGSVDLFDENGMTALQHAAYKGNKEMVQLLLDRGADVNSGKHEYNYTALHFGALSGNSEVCKLLLDAGAKSIDTNSVGRTASQMAAFVGNHHTVATINTYVPKSEIAYFTISQGEKADPVLPPYLIEPLHKFILCVNIHPVRVALNVQHCTPLLENANKVQKVLEMLCKREMTKGSETNEVMAFKYHYLSFLVREIFLIHNKQKANSELGEKRYDVAEIIAKRLLKPGRDGYSLDLMDTFLKDLIREFPFRECTTFHQMVSSLTSDDPPPAFSVINCTINGQRGFVDAIAYCSTCGEEKPAKKCSKCKSVQYCDRECQRLHWFVHKKACNRDPNTSISTRRSNLENKENIDVAELSSELQNLVSS